MLLVFAPADDFYAQTADRCSGYPFLPDLKSRPVPVIIWTRAIVGTNSFDILEQFADRGLIAVTVKVGNTAWQTSLLPMGDGTHFIALPAKARLKENLSPGAEVEVAFETRTRKSK